MDQNEVIARVIGILTESRNMYEALNQDPEADYETSNAIGTLFNEMFLTVMVPANATPQRAGEMVAQAAVDSTIQIAGAFAFLFSELAAAHDAGRTDITTADLMKEIALRFSDPQPED